MIRTDRHRGSTTGRTRAAAAAHMHTWPSRSCRARAPFPKPIGRPYRRRPVHAAPPGWSSVVGFVCPPAFCFVLPPGARLPEIRAPRTHMLRMRCAYAHPGLTSGSSSRSRVPPISLSLSLFLLSHHPRLYLRPRPAPSQPGQQPYISTHSHRESSSGFAEILR
jgi:hypothetical protein